MYAHRGGRSSSGSGDLLILRTNTQRLLKVNIDLLDSKAARFGRSGSRPLLLQVMPLWNRPNVRSIGPVGFVCGWCSSCGQSQAAPWVCPTMVTQFFRQWSDLYNRILFTTRFKRARFDIFCDVISILFRLVLRAVITVSRPDGIWLSKWTPSITLCRDCLLVSDVRASPPAPSPNLSRCRSFGSEARLGTFYLAG